MDSQPARTDLHRREAEFSDEWAQSTPIDDVMVRQYFEAPTALENRFIMNLLGPIEGKSVLDIGAGLGESSVYFALRGCSVTMVDISPEMVRLAGRLAERHGVSIQGFVMSAEDLPFQDNQFDIVYMANTLHHIHDREHMLLQIHRVLKPGGCFVSWDPVAYNPVINVYRRMATMNRTEDETPLRVADLKLVKRHFRNVRHREFWIASLALFLKYYLVDRVHPNDDRYWKRILKESPQSLRWWAPLARLDGLLTSLPGIRWLAWNMVMYGQKG
jgi:SAM-dependent methyltransferase